MLSNERLLELGHQHKLIKYSFAAGDVLAFGRAVEEAVIENCAQEQRKIQDRQYYTDRMNEEHGR